MFVNELPKLLARYEAIQSELLEYKGGDQHWIGQKANELKRIEIRIKVAESHRAIWAFWIAASGFGLNVLVRVVDLVLTHRP